jgi:PAS domain S-box-containing protein
VQVTAYLTGYCNLAYSALACFRTGMSASFQRDQVLGKNTHDLIHHHRQDGTPFPIEECRVHRLTNGEGVHAEDEVFWRANGTSFPAEYWAYPQRRGEEVVGAVVAFIDITERKLAESALANVSRKLIEHKSRSVPESAESFTTTSVSVSPYWLSSYNNSTKTL